MPDATAQPTPGNGTLLTEQIDDENGSYEQQWFTQPPAPGVTFLVTDCTWSPDRKTRKIYAVSPGRGSEQR